jgi:hypothetical protein
MIGSTVGRQYDQQPRGESKHHHSSKSIRSLQRHKILRLKITCHCDIIKAIAPIGKVPILRVVVRPFLEDKASWWPSLSVISGTLHL